MSSAESLAAQPAALCSEGSAVRATAAARRAVARVLGIEPSTLREDTPLLAVGWDSLARICWVDTVAEDGWRADSAVAGRAVTVADLAQCLRPGGGR